MRWAVFLCVALLSNGALADGRCDLNTLIGYQIIAAKPIASYIENGTRHPGYQGCSGDRVIVFADNSGVRCQSVSTQPAPGVPNAYIFANQQGDLKLCVEGELMDVTRTN